MQNRARRRFYIGIRLLAICGCFAGIAAPSHGDDPGYRHSARSQKPFREVIADLKFAITEHNYRITGENAIGSALSRRHGREYPQALVLHFCNLEEAAQILKAAPDFLLHMPCKVVVYETDEGVVVETWLLPEDARVREHVAAVNAMLQSIVDAAVE